VKSMQSPRMLAVVGVLAIVATACGGGGSTTASPTGGVTRGGTYRTATESFGFTGGFDPTGEYLSSALALYSQLLLRTLVTYNHVAGTAGDKIVPDVASSWESSVDGLTWTFHLKSGVKFGPPLNRDVTSKDFAFAFQRINSKSLAAQYGYYYAGTIKGLTGDAKSQEQTIPGISTPDDSTIIFHLTKPTGDFLYRVSMPAAAAMPPEVAGCFDKAGDYGRYVISDGPYMIKGEDALDTSSCSSLKPISGYDPTKFMVLVRNPAYDPSTDNPADRENNVDGVIITIDTNTTDIYDKIQSGELDGNGYPAGDPPATILNQYLTNPDLKDRLDVNSGDRTWYITMNLLTPPFDDIHVRKAVNYVINKAALQKAWGGPSHGQIGTSIEPPTVLPTTADFNPYPTPNNQGDLTAAMNEMKQSKYDSNHDGKCDASVCNNVLMVSRNISQWLDMDPTIQQDLAEIGINLKIRELDTSTSYTTINTVNNLIPIAANAGWGKDYADPYTFAVLFLSAGIACTGQVNYSEVGMTEAQARECGPETLAAWNAVTNSGANPLPSMDAKGKECYALQGDARTSCWSQFDKTVMNDVVPWVPYLWSNVININASTVTKFEFDQFSGVVSYTHIAVNNGIDPNTVPVS
jgi:peptide/nickel transport system substrate-binding protein